MLPDFERAARIGGFWSYSHSRTFAQLLIDWHVSFTPEGRQARFT